MNNKVRIPNAEDAFKELHEWGVAHAKAKSLREADVVKKLHDGRNTGRWTFNEKVWQTCAKIPKGRVSTYKEIARALKTKAYRAIGNALNRNPYAPIVPCHRVVNNDGRLGGYAGGPKKKIKLLEKEGIRISKGKVADFGKILFKFRT